MSTLFLTDIIVAVPRKINLPKTSNLEIVLNNSCFMALDGSVPVSKKEQLLYLIKMELLSRNLTKFAVEIHWRSTNLLQQC